MSHYDHFNDKVTVIECVLLHRKPTRFKLWSPPLKVDNRTPYSPTSVGSYSGVACQPSALRLAACYIVTTHSGEETAWIKT